MPRKLGISGKFRSSRSVHAAIINVKEKKDWKTADFHILATIIEFNVQWISQHHFGMKGKYRGNSIVT